MSKLVTGIFHTRDEAERAVAALLAAGYSRDDVSLLLSDETRGREFGVVESNKAPEGAATGAAVGGGLGALVAGLAAVATIAVPGAGLLASGPLVAALAGLGAGATAGGLTGALIGLGMSEHKAKLYTEEIERGGILVGVYAHDDRKKTAEKILDEAGAEKVN